MRTLNAPKRSLEGIRQFHTFWQHHSTIWLTSQSSQCRACSYLTRRETDTSRELSSDGWIGKNLVSFKALEIEACGGGERQARVRINSTEHTKLIARHLRGRCRRDDYIQIPGKKLGGLGRGSALSRARCMVILKTEIVSHITMSC